MKQEPNSLDLSIIFLGLTIASPIAWEHHYGVLLPIFAVLVPTALPQKTFGKWTTAYLLVAFLLISQKLDKLTNLLWNSPLNFVQSYMFFGALLLLILLFRVTYLQTRRITG
jgi:alpha-1,2-mannosyltransferase